jgi:hypothetical protein
MQPMPEDWSTAVAVRLTGSRFLLLSLTPAGLQGTCQNPDASGVSISPGGLTATVP